MPCVQRRLSRACLIGVACLVGIRCPGQRFYIHFSLVQDQSCIDLGFRALVELLQRDRNAPALICQESDERGTENNECAVQWKLRDLKSRRITQKIADDEGSGMAKAFVGALYLK